MIPGKFSVLTKELGKKIGLYDNDTITEGFDLTLKIFKIGGKVNFIPTLFVGLIVVILGKVGLGKEYDGHTAK